MSVENKAYAMKKQERKRNKLIFRMLPKIVVERMNSGKDVAESFESATLFFSSVIEFRQGSDYRFEYFLTLILFALIHCSQMTKNCSAMQVVSFLNELYSVMDARMDEFDVYKVE